METNKKLGFFKKFKIAIFNLEKYGLLITERLSKSIKYLLLLVLIFTICTSALYTYDTIKMINKGFNFIEKQMPDFKIETGVIQFENQVNGYDEEYDLKVISYNANNLTEEQLNELKKTSKYLVLLNNKMILNIDGISEEYTYSYMTEAFDVELKNKQDLIDLYNSVGGNTYTAITVFVTFVMTMIITNFYQTFSYCLIVAIFGYFAARICKVKIRFSTALTLSIYSLTLSMVLNLIYTVVYYFTNFKIQYFEWLYLVIGYIYIVAAILIIKTDLIKHLIELQKIEKEQKQVAKELEEEKQEEKKEDKEKNENKEEKKQEEDSVPDAEPDGSEI